jgi:hypothetical protein
MFAGARLAAGGVPAACLRVRSRVRWLLEQALPWHSGSCNDGGDGGGGRLGSVRHAGLEQSGGDTEQGSMQSRGHSRSAQKHG